MKYAFKVIYVWENCIKLSVEACLRSAPHINKTLTVGDGIYLRRQTGGPLK